MLLCLQIAPIYLASCIKQGMGLLEILLSKQPVQNNQVLLKVIDSPFNVRFFWILVSYNLTEIFVIDSRCIYFYADYRDMPSV